MFPGTVICSTFSSRDRKVHRFPQAGVLTTSHSIWDASLLSQVIHKMNYQEHCKHLVSLLGIVCKFQRGICPNFQVLPHFRFYFYPVVCVFLGRMLCAIENSGLLFTASVLFLQLLQHFPVK